MSLEQRVQTALAAHPEDKKLRLLASGYRDAWNACSTERTAANLKGLETWEGRLSAYLDDLPDAPGQEAKALPDPLQNLHQVWQYLRELGYSCSKAQPARAVKENKLSARKGGGFTQAEVRRYAVTHRLKRLPSAETPADDKPALPGVGAEPTGAADKKAMAAARLMEAQAEKAELALAKEKGLLVPAADMAITLASFGAVIESELKNSLRQSAPKLIGAVNGDQGRVAQLRRMLLDAVDSGLRHAASVDEYKVHFEALGGGQQ